MVDVERVRDKLALLRTYRAALRALPREPDADRYARRYLVQSGIQVCIDLANHLIASEGLATATDFRTAFVRLTEHGVIDDPLSTRLQSMVGMRNLLVHAYEVIDDALVAQTVEGDLDDWDAFARAIAAYARGATDDG